MRGSSGRAEACQRRCELSERRCSREKWSRSRVRSLDMGDVPDACFAIVSADASGFVALLMIDAIVTTVGAILGPNLGWIVPAAAVIALVAFPMLRRGPNSSSRDVWRGFRYAPRQTVLARAGGRCEGAALVAWGRCSSPAVEVDHVFPWSRGGPTVVSNGQALCAAHNRSKGAMNPPWWYVLSLERRRRGYFPEGADVRVFAVMGAGDRAARPTVAGSRSEARTGR
jgi:hypothetical protein